MDSHDIFAIVAMASSLVCLCVALGLTIKRTYEGKKMIGYNFPMIFVCLNGILGVLMFGIRSYLYPDAFVLQVFSMILYYVFLVMIGMSPHMLMPIVSALDLSWTKYRIKLFIVVNLFMNLLLSLLALWNFFDVSLGVINV